MGPVHTASLQRAPCWLPAQLCQGRVRAAQEQYCPPLLPAPPPLPVRRADKTRSGPGGMLRVGWGRGGAAFPHKKRQAAGCTSEAGSDNQAECACRRRSLKPLHGGVCGPSLLLGSSNNSWHLGRTTSACHPGLRLLRPPWRPQTPALTPATWGHIHAPLTRVRVLHTPFLCGRPSLPPYPAPQRNHRHRAVRACRSEAGAHALAPGRPPPCLRPRWPFTSTSTWAST